MASELLAKFDEINRALLNDLDVRKAIEKIKNVAGGLNRILEGSPEVFAEAMGEVIRNIEPPKAGYKGPSQRVKRKLEARAIS